MVFWGSVRGKSTPVRGLALNHELFSFPRPFEKKPRSNSTLHPMFASDPRAVHPARGGAPMDMEQVRSSLPISLLLHFLLTLPLSIPSFSPPPVHVVSSSRRRPPLVRRRQILFRIHSRVSRLVSSLLSPWVRLRTFFSVPRSVRVPSLTRWALAVRVDAADAVGGQGALQQLRGPPASRARVPALHLCEVRYVLRVRSPLPIARLAGGHLGRGVLSSAASRRSRLVSPRR